MFRKYEDYKMASSWYFVILCHIFFNDSFCTDNQRVIIISKTNISTLYDIKHIPEKMLTRSFQKDLHILSYDIICDDTCDGFSIEAENIRNGDIPKFWHYLFMNYPYLDIDGMLNVSKNILKYLDSLEEEE